MTEGKHPVHFRKRSKKLPSRPFLQKSRQPLNVEWNDGASPAAAEFSHQTPGQSPAMACNHPGQPCVTASPGTTLCITGKSLRNRLKPSGIA
jgi:hypothetical protein